MKDSLQRYFLAILPGDELSREARLMQQEFYDKHGARAALRSPPHITLHMPFNWKERKEVEMVKSLSRFVATIKPFQAKIDGFGAFPPRVIFMNVLGSVELGQCQQKLARFCRMELGLLNAEYRDEPYHPHLTIAFRDLKKPAFMEAWDSYRHRSFSSSIDVNDITLLRHDGKEWKAYKAFTLAGA